MNKLPSQIRRMVAARIEYKGSRDEWMMGYSSASASFWLAGVDAKGAIDHEFAEPMAPAAYRTLMHAVAALARQRGGALTADVVMIALRNRTLQ